MHRCETGREGRALNTIVSNQPESAAKGAAFASARAAALRVMGADALRGAVFLEGGLAPWLASGRDSGRLHGDVDFSVRLRDMPAVREWLAGEGLYDRALDSLDLACNASRADFGVHAIVGGVPVSFCPFSFDGGALIQRNAALRRFEGFDALFEARIPGIAEDDFAETRRLPSVGAVGFSTLEACRASKGASGRPKDAADIGEIDRIGVDPSRLGRVEAAFSRMRVECVAHEGAESGSPDPVPDSAHWVRGVLDAASSLDGPARATLFGSCASRCIVGRGLLARFGEILRDAGGDIGAFFSLLGGEPGVSTEALVPGRAWAMEYASCTCPLVAGGLADDPVLCECSRRSVLFVLGELFPGSAFEVELGETVLSGGRACRFEIRLGDGTR